jgi:glutaredoxin
MTNKRTVEILSAGCPVCKDVISLVDRLACSFCEITVMDMNTSKIEKMARALGIRSVPAVVIDGRLADCCSNDIHEGALTASGVGQPLGT